MARGLWATAAVAGSLPGAMGRQCMLVHVQRNTLEDLPLTDLRIAGGWGEGRGGRACALQMCRTATPIVAIE